MRALWQRYLLKELCSTLLFFLAATFFLYVAIDYAVHTKVLRGVSYTATHLIGYYLCQFPYRAPILLPFALLLTAIRVLVTLNTRNELVALLAGGLRLSTILRPVLLVATIACGLLLANYQWLYPLASKTVETFHHPLQPNKAQSLHALALADQSTLLFQRYDPTTRSLFDVYWLENPHTIWRMKRFFPDSRRGEFVDHLACLSDHLSKNDGWTRIDSSTEQIFVTIPVSYDLLTQPEQLSLSTLWRTLPPRHKNTTDRDAAISTALLAKLSYPLLCFLVVLVPAPFCLRFGRHLPIFLIYSLAIMGFLLVLTSLNATVILGENQVVSPLLAFGILMGGTMGLAVWRYARL